MPFCISKVLMQVSSSNESPVRCCIDYTRSTPRVLASKKTHTNLNIMYLNQTCMCSTYRLFKALEVFSCRCRAFPYSSSGCRSGKNTGSQPGKTWRKNTFKYLINNYLILNHKSGLSLGHPVFTRLKTGEARRPSDRNCVLSMWLPIPDTGGSKKPDLWHPLPWYGPRPC